MELEWAPVPGFPNYLISTNGDIVNGNSGRWLSVSQTQEGVPKVGLVEGNTQYTRSVAVLVASAFVPGRDNVSDTVVHLDGNTCNNSSHNLVWRPRWFAWAYASEISAPSVNDRIGPLRCVVTGTRYVDIFEAAQACGLLPSDIRKSIVMSEAVFPTLQRFEMV